MAGLWDILLPKLATNYLKNPSFEASTLISWTDAGSGAGSYTLSFSNEYAAFGVTSLGVSCLGAITVTVYQDVSDLTMNEGYVGSVYVLCGTASVTLTLSEGGGSTNPVSVTNTGSAAWERITVTKSAPASGSIRVTLTVVSTTSNQVYFDGAQLENSAVGQIAYGISTYLDGDQPGCVWNGTRYASTSTRSATERSGGSWIDLQTYGAYVTAVSGLGIGDNELSLSPFALRDGGEIRQVRIPSRNWMLGFTIKGSSQSNLHTLRQTLTNLFYSARWGSFAPCYFRYRGGAVNMIIPAFYEGGMSYSQVGQDGFAENVGARFVLEDAVIYRENQSIYQLDFSNSIFASAYNIARLSDGQWVTPGSGFNGVVTVIAEKYDGTIIAGGAFTDTGGGEAFNRIASFDGDTWTTLLGTDGQVSDIALTPDGNMYVGGVFTTAGAATVNRIAKYDGDTWTALDGGANGDVYSVAVADNGNVYIAGDFTTVGSTPITTSRIAMYNGDTWSAVPTSATGADVAISAITFDSAGLLYAGGAFTAISGTAALRVAVYNGTSWSAMGSGFNGLVRCLLATPDGYLYAGGDFTDTGGGEAINSVARWNGSTWEALSTTNLSSVYSLAYQNGTVYIGAAGVVTGTPFVEWNGTNFFISTINIPGSSFVNTIVPTSQGNRLWIGGTLSDTTSTQAGTNVVTVNGSGYTQPKLTIIGAGTTTVYWLQNLTTGQKITLNMDVLNGERVVIDFAKSTVTSSNGRNLFGTILSGSDFSTFRLASGANTIIAFAVSTGAPKLILTWPETEIGL